MPRFDVLVAGETVVDFVPSRPGPLDEVEQFDRRAGGAPANVAVGLAHLGRTPAFWTRLGGDPFGDFLATTLDREGLPSRFVERDPGAKTTLAFVAHDAAADRSFAFYRDRAADARLEPGRVPDETLRDVAWVVVGGVPLSTEPSRSALFDLVDRARAAGTTVVFDPNVRPELWDDDVGPVVGEMLERADVVKASIDDLHAVGLRGVDLDGTADCLDGTPDDLAATLADHTGTPDDLAATPTDLADAVIDRGPHTVFLTLGADGALVRSSERAPWGATATRHPGYDVATVDATGAGDAFTAGVVDALADGESLPEALSVASAVAALSTTAEGAMTALPDREAVAAFRSERNPGGRDPGERDPGV